MALVVFLRGINVGGHRTLRPSILAKQLSRFDAVSIGAAGTFVIRQPIPRARLRAEIARRLPFDAEIIICEGREILRLISQNPFGSQPVPPEIVRLEVIGVGPAEITLMRQDNPLGGSAIGLGLNF
jgi:uncharacterized protein (DUF1697 family)